MTDEITSKEEIAVEAPKESIPEPIQAPEAPTAQIPVSEPLPTPTETEAEPVVEPISTEIKPVETEIRSEPISESISEPEVKVELKTEEVKPEIIEPIQTEPKPVEQIPEVKPEPVSESKPEPEPEPKPIPEIIPVVGVISKSKSLARELLVKARNMIQFRKRKKLDKIISLFAKQTKITNDEVEKFLHVSDATATRYLSQLEKEGKIKRNGKTGKSVFYSKI
ncbi:MAG: DeoR family transcriptional regulator [Candidatus Paceibacterota bacterium]